MVAASGLSHVYPQLGGVILLYTSNVIRNWCMFQIFVYTYYMYMMQISDQLSTDVFSNIVCN